MEKKHKPFNKHGARKLKAQKVKQKKKSEVEKQEITLLEASKAKVSPIFFFLSQQGRQVSSTNR